MYLRAISAANALIVSYFTPEHEATHKAPLAPVWLKAATGHAAFPRDDLTRICEGYKLDMVWASAPG
ncbi:MAG: hypothetical protein V9G14_11415 [Cypionkella sp.]